MGTYAKFYVEQKSNDGKWHIVDSLTKAVQKETIQCYDLYAILANVRNYEDFKCICEPKGMPEDSPLYSRYRNNYDTGEFWDTHSHSWLTLKEILDFDWEQKIIHRYWLNPIEYADYKKTGEIPDGPNPRDSKESKIRQGEWPVTCKMMDESTIRLAMQSNWIVQVDGDSETYHEASGNLFFKIVVEPMKQLVSDNGTSEDIRIVFWFD